MGNLVVGTTFEHHGAVNGDGPLPRLMCSKPVAFGRTVSSTESSGELVDPLTGHSEHTGGVVGAVLLLDPQ